MSSDSTLRRLNEYLFYEFGHDLNADPSSISPTSPFQLEFLGTLDEEGRDLEVFSFEFDGEAFFVIDGPSLEAQHAGGMSLSDLQAMRVGSRWIAAQDPVDLSMSLPGDTDVPANKNRAADILALASKAGLDEGATVIAHGLYLRRTGAYLAAVHAGDPTETWLVGTDREPTQLPLPDASAPQRLAAFIGMELGSN